jgi:uncharacterized membrane protein YqjE
MDTSEGAPPAGGLRAALARAGESALGLLRTRAELAGVELVEERERLVLRLALLIAGGVVLAFSGLFVGVFVIALLWDSYRLTAIAAVAVLYALGGWLLISKAQAIGRDAPSPFAATLAEFEKDRIRMQRAAGNATGRHES